MLLTELTPISPIKKSLQKANNTFTSRIGDWRRIGKGGMASVWSHPAKQYLVKIFSKEDTCYPKFVELVQKNPSPYFPKFIGKVTKVANNKLAIRVERLELLNRNVYLDIIAGFGAHRKLKMMQKHPFLTKPLILLKSRYEKDLDFINKEYPGLIEAYDLLLENRNSSECNFDFNTGNIMRRGDIPVIIDPWFPRN